MSSQPSPILELSNVSFSYRRNGSFISGLSCSAGEAEFIGLLGANGSGKSTILKLAAGILRSSAGSVRLWGRPMGSYENRDRAKLISYLPQSLDLTIPFTIRELVSMGLYPYDIPPSMNAEDALAMVGLREKADAHLMDLSGGERRRTFIAMTLLQGAGILLLDEPLANLDIRYQIELVRLLRRLREERRITVVMALHDINLAFQFERVLLIKDGRVLGSGRPETVLTQTLIEESFGVPVVVRKSENGGSYISYEQHF